MKTSTILRSLEVLPGAIWTVCHSLAFVHLQCYHAKGQFSTVSTETFLADHQETHPTKMLEKTSFENDGWPRISYLQQRRLTPK